jgi:hypothetical protein
MENLQKFNEISCFDDYEFDIDSYTALADTLVGDVPQIATAQTLCMNYDSGIVYNVVKDMAQGWGGIENVPEDALIEQVELEAQSYEGEDSDGYDSESLLNVDDIIEGRHQGRMLQGKIDSFNKAVERKAKISGKSEDDLILKTLQQSPNAILQIKTYVQNRGYTPSNNLLELVAQLANARNEHINEKISNYDADNFNKAFKRRQKRRQERRLTRIQDRIVRRKARKQGRIDQKAMGDLPEEEQQEIREETESLPIYADKGSAQAAREEEPVEILNPTVEDANAEILYEEYCGNAYDCFDGDADNFLPFLGGALKLGAKVMGQANNDENPLTAENLNELKSLFKKQPKGQKKGSTKAQIKSGTDAIMKEIEGQKKKEFLQQNGLLIAAGLVAIFLLGQNWK